jgi:hypothetical protein
MTLLKSLCVFELSLAGLLFCPAKIQAEDWPQWQGPDRNAISRERGLLQEWPKEGPPLAWKIAGLGGGDSAPAIAAGRIYGMANRGEDEVVWALSDGRLYYRVEDGPMVLIEPSPKQYIERGRFDQPDRTALPAWAHPVIANGKLYVRDQDVLFCYDVKAK